MNDKYGQMVRVAITDRDYHTLQTQLSNFSRASGSRLTVAAFVGFRIRADIERVRQLGISEIHKLRQEAHVVGVPLRTGVATMDENEWEMVFALLRVIRQRDRERKVKG